LLGATHTINYVKTPVWHPEVRAVNGGRGVDHVIEVGGPDSFLQSLQAIRIGGQINMVGYIGINPLEILYHRATVRGIPVGSRVSFEAMNRAIEANNMRRSSIRCFRGQTPSPQSATCKKESISEKSSSRSQQRQANRVICDRLWRRMCRCSSPHRRGDR
jgi:NADPH:quinone reductase-like Zn-dependent oxidoreductase